MKVIEDIAGIRQEIKELKLQGKRISFVPTMGALHAGHRSLFHMAHEDADIVVVSIYVNPEQFGPNEDFAEYPRQLEADLDVCKKENIDIVFTPTDQIIYGDEKFLHIEIDTLADHMDGGSRPGYFNGILLVVNKLFNIIQPHSAVFGQKDIQQFILIDKMVQEFNHDLDMLMAPVARAEDGLALSSRNAYLTDEERAIAPSLQASMQHIRQKVLTGAREVRELLETQKDELIKKGFKFDYLSFYSTIDLSPISMLKDGEQYILAGAVYAGKTRLIDNLLIQL